MIDELLQQGKAWHIERATFDQVCRNEGLSRSEVYNSLALEISRQFLAGQVTFEEADGVANEMFNLIVQDMAESPSTFTRPEPAWSVYLAFDDGEWLPKGEEGDPVEKFTKPQLRKILAA